MTKHSLPAAVLLLLSGAALAAETQVQGEEMMDKSAEAAEAAAPESELAVPPAFEELDANADGYLSEAEVASVADVDFQQADADQDGQLTDEEYRRAINAPPPGTQSKQ
ncbi:MAG: hypothetical protein M3Z21_11610 [Pseudomonadota bacterium]|nr:hypothetical protein [Pseudomonadota bacterium]